MSLTVRISEPCHKALKELADLTGEPMQAILAKAIEEYRRRRFLERANAAFAKLRKTSTVWKHELQERALWNRALRDGLDQE